MGLFSTKKDTSEDTIACSFCGKPQHEVQKIVAGPEVTICDECVGLCNDIFEREGLDPPQPMPPIRAAEAVAEAMRREVVGQESAVVSMLGALRQHLVGGLERDPTWPTHPVVMIAGPPGCGKTTLARAFASASPVPAFLGSIDRVTATGYIGEDIEGFLSELVQRTPRSSQPLAERGCLFVDDVQRLVPKTPGPGLSRDVSGVEVQRALLRVLDGQACALWDGANRHPQSPHTPFRTDGLLRVLIAQVEAEVGTSPEAIHEALAESGIIRPLLSRVNVIVPMTAPTAADLSTILVRPEHGKLDRAKRFLAEAQVEVAFSSALVEQMVERALGHDDGAWSLDRQVTGLVHRLASWGASGRVSVQPADLEF